MRRREALVIGGVIAAAIALPSVLRRLPSDFEFEPLPGFDGFRRIKGGAVSGGADPFVGLGERLPAPADPPPEPLGNLCQALFGPEGWTADRLPVAVFTDFNCPYCRTLDLRLLKMRDEGAPIRLVWHDYPLLGQGSYRAAKAALAAAFLGREDAARDYLWKQGLRPGPTALADMAGALDLPPDMLRREIDGRRVINAVGRSLELGGRLGIPGTPGTMVGRTLVIGAIRPPDLEKLIALEIAEVPPDCG